MWTGLWTWVAVMSTGCSAATGVAESAKPTPCQVWVYLPTHPPVLWTCATTTDPSNWVGKPCTEDRVDDESYTHVASCEQCTPRELLQLNPWAQCSPDGEEKQWKFAPDGGQDLGE